MRLAIATHLVRHCQPECPPRSLSPPKMRSGISPVASPPGAVPSSRRTSRRRYGLGAGVVRSALQRLEIDGRVLEGEYRPGGSGREWIDVEVLRRLRRMSLAAFRKEVEPAPPEALARFAQVWHGMDSRRKSDGLRAASIDDMFRTIEQLQGVPLVASALERTMLKARLSGYRPALLDELLIGRRTGRPESR